MTSDERRAIQLEIDAALAEARSCIDEANRLQAMLDAQPAGSDGDTLRMLRPLCSCGLPLDHRRPLTGEPLPCIDETARIAPVDGGGRHRSGRPPVPTSVTRDVSQLVRDGLVDPAVADEFAAQVSRDLEDLR